MRTRNHRRGDNACPSGTDRPGRAPDRDSGWDRFQHDSTKTEASLSLMSQAIVFAHRCRSKCLDMAAYRRHRLGRKLVFPVGEHPFDLSLANRAELVAASTAIRSALTSPASPARAALDRPHRIFRRTPVAQQLVAQLRPLPWSVVRPLSVWHRNQRQNGLPVRRWQTCPGRHLETGRNSRHVSSREKLPGRRTATLIPKSQDAPGLPESQNCCSNIPIPSRAASRSE